MKIGLALGGGGALGFYHIGVLKGLHKINIKIDIVGGVSIGAIIGGVYALSTDPGYVEKISFEFIKKYENKFSILKRFRGSDSLEEKKVFLSKTLNMAKGIVLTNLQLFRSHLVNPEAFYRIIRGAFKDKTFSDCRIPFMTAAVDLLSGNLKIFTTGPLYKAVSASAAVPGFFPPLPIDNKLYADGSILLFTGGELIKRPDTFVIGVSLKTIKEPSTRKMNAIDTYFRVDEIRFNHLAKIKEQFTDYNIPLNIKNVSWLDFDRVHELLLMGEQVVLEKENEIKAAIRNARIRRFFFLKF